MRDDGSGFPEDTLPSDVFEFGYTTEDDGTGFGLAIVQDIVEAHDWEISADELSDGGVRFTIDMA